VHGDLAAGQVEVLQQQEGRFLLAERVDGDQGDGDFGDGGVGSVAEDDLLLLECPEQAAQGGQQVVRPGAGVLAERPPGCRRG
jgi:hypothetical protein